MNHLEQMLEKLGLKYEDLNYLERETYKASFFNTQNISLQDLKDRIEDLKDAISLQLTDTQDTPENSLLNTSLKARLKNYMVLLMFLKAPEQAEKALKKATESNVSNKVL